MKPISKISSFSSSTLRLLKALAIVGPGLLACAPTGCVPADRAGPAPVVESAPEIGAEMFRAADGVSLPMRSWLPAGEPKAVVLALHGFGDYSAAFSGPAGFWANHGVAVYAYDQRGFGGSPHVFHWSGTAVMVDDAKAVARALRRRYPATPLYLMGESMGGSVAIAATTGPDPAAVDGAILVSPAVWEHDLIGTIERSALGLTAMAAPGLWLVPPQGLGILPSDNIPMLLALGRDSLTHKGARVDTTSGLMELMDQAGNEVAEMRLPTLVLFGAHEQVLPKAAVSGFLARLPAAGMRVALYPDGYHMLLRDLHGPIVWSDALAWMQDRSAPLPSGDECRGMAASAAPCRKANAPPS